MKYKALIIICCVYLIPFGIYFLFSSKWDQLQTLAVIVTGAVIVWYTWETKILREEAQKQTELQIRPFLLIDPFIDPEYFGFNLVNVGNGPAINIKLPDIQVDSDHVIRFPKPILFLGPGNSVKISAKGFMKGIELKDFFKDVLFSQLNPDYANRILSFKIIFQAIDLRQYAIKEQIAPARMEILSINQKPIEV